MEIIYISMVLWFLPLIKNYKKKYFVLFLGIALGDPISLFLLNKFGLNPNYWSVLCLLCVIYSFGQAELKIRQRELFIIGISVFSLIFGFPSNILTLILNVIIQLYILSHLLFEIISMNKINIFVFVLAFYNLTIILNTLFMSNSLVSSEYYYYYSVVVMYIFAIFFTFTNEKTKFLQVNINKYLARLNDD